MIAKSRRKNSGREEIASNNNNDDNVTLGNWNKRRCWDADDWEEMSSDFEITCGGAGPPPDASGLNHQPWMNNVQVTSEEHLRSTTERQQHQQRCCTRCWTAGCTWLTSALGVSTLLMIYLITGAIMFMILGNQDIDHSHKSIVQQQQQPSGRIHHHQQHSQYADPDGRLLEKTLATVDRLWSITEDLNILYRDNWTHLARVEMRHYQDQIVRTLRQMMLDERYSFKQTWTFPMSLLYALTLITTIGYGFYTPSTLLAKSLTTAYSLLGIPLFLLYLSVVGERLARIINRMTLSCCCCCNDNMAVVISGDDEDEEEITGGGGSGPRPGRRRIGAYRQYSDVTLALQPMSFRGAGSNGHAAGHQELNCANTGQPFKDDAAAAAAAGTMGGGRASACCCSSDTTQVPLLVCAGLLAVFIGLASLLLVLFEPQLGFFGSLHLTINLLMTLGFAGNLLPGMSAEASAAAALDSTANHRDDPSLLARNHPSQGVGSQISLIIVACLILLGTTLLSSSFSVLMDNIARSSSAGPSSSAADDAGQSRIRSAASTTCYHHMPSPSRQFS